MGTARPRRDFRTNDGFRDDEWFAKDVRGGYGTTGGFRGDEWFANHPRQGDPRGAKEHTTATKPRNGVHVV